MICGNELDRLVAHVVAQCCEIKKIDRKIVYGAREMARLMTSL